MMIKLLASWIWDMLLLTFAFIIAVEVAEVEDASVWAIILMGAFIVFSSLFKNDHNDG